MPHNIWRLMLAAMLALLLSGCGQSDSKIYTLRIGAGHPSGATVYVTQLHEYFVPEVVRRVKAETDYEVRFVEGYGGSIAKVAETLESVQSGILDIGAYCVCFEPSKLFLHNFMYFAPFGPQNSQQSVSIARSIYDQHPWLERQLSEKYGQQLLALNGWDNYHLGTVNAWDTVADLRGVKIAGAGPNLPWLAYAGVTPVQSALPDAYLSLETGVYDGWLMFPSAYYSFKLHEPAPHYTLIGFGAMGGAVVVTANSKRFNRLPPEVRAIILEVAREYEEVAARSLDDRQAKGLKDLARSGAILRTLPEDAQTRWSSSLARFPNDMAQEANRRGMPGSIIMKAYLDEITKRGHRWPVSYEID